MQRRTDKKAANVAKKAKMEPPTKVKGFKFLNIEGLTDQDMKLCIESNSVCDMFFTNAP